MSKVIIEDGNVQRLFEAAETGPFLRAELSSAAGKGKLGVTYDWLYSALNCTPNDDETFYWIFEKRSDDTIAISPADTPGHVPDTLFASVRDDWSWYVQTQAPHSADWITEVGRDERLSVVGTGILSVAIEGFNDEYVAVNHVADHHGGHTGYRLRSVEDSLAENCVFRVRNTTVLQDDLEFLEQYTVSEDDIRAVVNAYGLEMSDESVAELKAAFPKITPELLRNPSEIQRSLTDDASSGEAVGSVIGGLIGGVVGFIMGGPGGAAAGGGIGAGVGAQIGVGVELHQPHDDRRQVVDPDIPQVAKTQVNITPAGGPYDNKHLWEDLFSFAKFRQIGSSAMPDAGCLMPPDEQGRARVWFPSSRNVDPPVVDRKRYSPSSLGYMSIFVIVKLKNGTYQLRLHPDEALVNGPNRPNHSQLTQGSRLLALLGGKFEPEDSEQQMQVYAAGELYYHEDGRLRSVYPKTGHYFTRQAGFDDELLETTKRHLGALGYDTSEIEFHHFYG